MGRVEDTAPTNPLINPSRDKLGYRVGQRLRSVSGTLSCFLPRVLLPSRANRKALTMWPDASAIKQLKQLGAELGVSQQARIAEGINHVLAKCRKPTMAT